MKNTSEFPFPLLVPKTVPGKDEVFIQAIHRVLREALDDPDLGISHFCRAVNLSRYQVHRRLKALTGESATTLIRSARLQKARQLLRSGNFSVSQVSFEVGFRDPAYFSRVFAREFGFPPSELLRSEQA